MKPDLTNWSLYLGPGSQKELGKRYHSAPRQTGTSWPEPCKEGSAANTSGGARYPVYSAARREIEPRAKSASTPSVSAREPLRAECASQPSMRSAARLPLPRASTVVPAATHIWGGSAGGGGGRAGVGDGRVVRAQGPLALARRKGSSVQLQTMPGT